MPRPPGNAADPLVAAKSAGLRYVNDDDPGICREAAGKEFRYRGPEGRRITDAPTLGRIKRLAIPPAWTEVWICPRDDGHIQATGRDARERMIAFGKALPKIRQRVARDLRRPGLGREKVLATMLRLLETTLIRVGNEEYVRANGSVGLSTMRDRHVAVKSGTMQFQFKGKSGKHHRIELHDPRLAKIVRQAQDLPGQDLFQYVDADGRTIDVKSDDVNAYLRDIAGGEFSAKDFRTWAGTVLAAVALLEFQPFETKKQAKKNVVAAIERVAERLGNTPSVCRKCYVHPVVLDSYLDGQTIELILKKTEAALGHDAPALSRAEKAVLGFLQRRLTQGRPAPMLKTLQRSVAALRRAPHRAARGGTSGGAGAAARSHTRKSPPSPRRRPRE
jgi:DNA topoisomerase I